MCMNLMLEQIEPKMKAFIKDATAQYERGNKAAGRRARRTSLELETLLKQFRKRSMAFSKRL